MVNTYSWLKYLLRWTTLENSLDKFFLSNLTKDKIEEDQRLRFYFLFIISFLNTYTLRKIH